MDLTIEEVAKRLNMPVETVERWIRQGKIPMQLSHGCYVIRSEMLTRWAEEYRLEIHLPQSVGVCNDNLQFDGIAAAMRRGGIVHGLAGDTKEACLQAAVDCIPNIASHERSLVFKKLVERERLASTGIGHGIALPHPRTLPEIAMQKPQITTCFLTRPIDFQAIDHQRVSVLMILLADSTCQHLTLLSKLSFFLRDAVFRDYLLAGPEAEALLLRLDHLESEKASGGA